MDAQRARHLASSAAFPVSHSQERKNATKVTTPNSLCIPHDLGHANLSIRMHLAFFPR